MAAPCIGLFALVVVPVALAQEDSRHDRDPVPRDSELASARETALGVVADLLVETRTSDAAIAQLLAAAGRVDRSAVRWILLEQAHRIALGASDAAQVLHVADATVDEFEVDPVDFLEQRLAELVRSGGMGAGGAASVWVERLEREMTSGDVALAQRYSARALDASRAMIDPVLTSQVDLQVSEITRRRDLLAVAPELFETGADAEPVTSLSHAAACTKHAARADDALTARLWRRAALGWYGAAWPGLDDLERARAVRLMDALSAGICVDSDFGRLRFASADALDELVLDRSAWRIEDGALRGQSADDDEYATFRYAFRRIRSVTIRGAITSEPGLNFRFAVGPLTAILNWELADQNHLWIGNRRTITSPRRLEAGREHEMVVRDLGGRVALFVDRELLFDEPLDGVLRGTVSVYPALGSEICVREVTIDGDVDPGVTVMGPSHPAR